MSSDHDENTLTSLDYINMIAPDHFRTSCEEGESYNARTLLNG